jgi:hypothetical protein
MPCRGLYPMRCVRLGHNGLSAVQEKGHRHKRKGETFPFDPGVVFRKKGKSSKGALGGVVEMIRT